MATPPIEVLTAREVMAILRIGRAALDRLFAKGLLKRSKVGSLVRVKKSDLERFLEMTAQQKK